MVSLNASSFVRVTNTKELVELLKEQGEKARILGGGTTLYEMGNRGLLSEVTILIDISALKLSYVRIAASGELLDIGASTTFTDLLENEIIRKTPGLGALIDALIAIKPIQVRNAATIAGCVCSGIPFFDLPVSLTALDVAVVICGPNGERKSLIEDFLGGFFTVNLERGEFVESFQLPVRKDGFSESAFEKFSLTGDDWAIVNCSTCLTVESKNGGPIHDSRVVVGGSGLDKITRIRGAEQVLEGARPTRELFKKASDPSLFRLEFISDARGSSEYKKRLAHYLLRICLDRTFDRLRSQGYEDR
jgi:CO/xanthine dehydrogenase FAD-binding subunit